MAKMIDDVNKIVSKVVDTSPQAILFDLDGTLVDSAPDLAAALNTTFKILDYPSVELEEVKKWIGNGVDKLIQRALSSVLNNKNTIQLDNSDEFWRAKTVFYSQYERQSGKLSRLYPGVVDLLEELQRKNIYLACITNKSRCFTTSLLVELGIENYFEVVVCGDDLTNKKPHPEPLLYAASKIGIQNDLSLMVGDSSSDVIAANAANMSVICVDYGYNQGFDLSSMRIDGLISYLPELIDCIGNNQFKKCG
ncbi:MAG: phosphoglycolate phosphatase [Kangiellaceae bacterium]|nr:phosphoglycolate phosphatase [Kangiellaceae bacterium]